MDKRVNDILNVIETISVLLGIACLISASLLRSASITILNPVLLILGFLIEIVISSTELFLFMNMKLKFKFTYILYLLLDLILALVVNEIFPFMGLVVIGIFTITKCLLRTRFMEEIYIPKKLKEYLKIFNIKLPRKKKSVKKIKKATKATKKKTAIKKTTATKTRKKETKQKETKKKETKTPVKNKKRESYA